MDIKVRTTAIRRKCKVVYGNIR